MPPFLKKPKDFDLLKQSPGQHIRLNSTFNKQVNKRTTFIDLSSAHKKDSASKIEEGNALPQIQLHLPELPNQHKRLSSSIISQSPLPKSVKPQLLKGKTAPLVVELKHQPMSGPTPVLSQPTKQFTR